MLERTHAEAIKLVTVEEYFTLLSKTLEDSGLKNISRQLYNCDETFLPLNCIKGKVVTHRDTKNMYCQSYGRSEHIILLCCASAVGIPHPPLIIYAKSLSGAQHGFEGTDDSVYAEVSTAGWTPNGSLFG